TPVLKEIVEYRRLKKLEGMDLRKYTNPATGRIHANIKQIGTATSRLSESSPNLQQIAAKTHLPVSIKVDEEGKIIR
ncbi:MAG: DNA polymerase, partial [Candidatus Bipolaricaulia bacterium]